MSIIQLKEANCKNCYKCIRNCDVKSISFQNDQAQIIDDDCVLCGKCTLICPQNAKQIQSDVQKVQSMIDRGEKVYVSLAPSFVAGFPQQSFAGVVKALRRLGFAGVEETAIAATKVSERYGEILARGEVPNLITTCCPTINMLVEKYFPELIDQLASVPSPAVAHCRMLREAYGPDCKVVFIGPCISKKHEAEVSGAMDAVLLFDEVREWLRRESIPVDGGEDESAREMHHTLSRVYPVPGGILKTIPLEQRKKYNAVAVDGLNRCIQTLRDIRDNKITGYVLEMSSCVDSCVGGPGLHEHGTPFLLSKSAVYDFSRRKPEKPLPRTEEVQVNMLHVYQKDVTPHLMPTEEEIWTILRSIGKRTQADLLNCGACGYNTCREKAIAVFQGKANLHMCLPYMRERAESMSNIILDNTPNGLILTNDQFEIIQFNQAATKLLNLDNACLGMPIDAFLNLDELGKIRETGKAIMGQRCKTAIYDVLVEQSVVPVPDHDYLFLLKDISAEEESMKAMAKMRKETMDTAQQVIDKQMRVAQEIASLLGETTGETKAALLKLKASVAQGDEP